MEREGGIRLVRLHFCNLLFTETIVITDHIPHPVSCMELNWTELNWAGLSWADRSCPAPLRHHHITSHKSQLTRYSCHDTFSDYSVDSSFSSVPWMDTLDGHFGSLRLWDRLALALAILLANYNHRFYPVWACQELVSVSFWLCFSFSFLTRFHFHVLEPDVTPTTSTPWSRPYSNWLRTGPASLKLPLFPELLSKLLKYKRRLGQRVSSFPLHIPPCTLHVSQRPLYDENQKLEACVVGKHPWMTEYRYTPHQSIKYKVRVGDVVAW